MIEPDSVSRTALLSAHDGTAETIEDAISAHRQTGVLVIADESVCQDGLGQAALTTAMATAARAFGQVHVMLGTPDAILSQGPYRGRNLGEIARAEGCEVVTETAASPTWPVILIGATTPLPLTATPCILRAVWSGWSAFVLLAKLASTPSPTESDTSLAAIAAGALGVSEAFDATRSRPGSDAGYRSISLNLWDPTDRTTESAPLAHAPYAWWLVGLGHLGQAYCWVITTLGYSEPSAVEIVLQDTDIITESTHSTGVLTPRGANGGRKTRHIAEILDSAGFSTRIIESRLDQDHRARGEDRHVALLGVDNLQARRITSGVGWALAIDVGLGTGPIDYASLVIRRFPANVRSNDVPAWQSNSDGEVPIPDQPAFRELAGRVDGCGLVELAGKAVGASFVGIVAACLAVAEATRELHGGAGHDVLTYDLLTAIGNEAPASSIGDVISASVNTTKHPGRPAGRYRSDPAEPC
jgi:hypothetical protein